MLRQPRKRILSLMVFSLPLLIMILDLVADGEKAGPENNSPRLVNIINFVRECEPRVDWITPEVLYQTVVEQIKIINQYNFKATFLLQYDALIDPRYQKLMKELPADRFEIGAWWEIPQPLVERSGYKWRGRYPWDWHANVGFATGYPPEEREKLIDTYMQDFKKIFGYYPKSVGSWFIDAHSLRYMHEKYGVVASCNCKDQVGTDGYTLWGGYWSGGYYPSQLNAYMPAQNAQNQIPVPIFRMLGSDPIHQYDSGLGTGNQSVISLEPVYEKGGGDESWCRWYFDWFINEPALNYAYVQVGQENSFTWKRMSQGYQIQMKILDELARKGKIVLQTLSETGRWFKENYQVTPPTSVVVLKDYSEKNLKTVWFNSRFYRANLLWEQGTLRFRDIHLFDEKVVSDYLKKPGTSTQCFYYTLPLVDGFFWSSTEVVAGLRFKQGKGKEIRGGELVVDAFSNGQLSVRWPTDSSAGQISIQFIENSIMISAGGRLKNDWYLELNSAAQAELPFYKIEPERLYGQFKNWPYIIRLKKGQFVKGESELLRILPKNGQIILDLSFREN
ncbi:MAG TPA: hypothetical protein ENO29_07450 [Candidatus Aminicenantes bacterium]|nr:MAG: hypothetical protein C0168_00185 [Candidatus Aminicenantes bacterium]HEK86171.1 hypothetical protein [Candidatus Aminicenantes bacterium]